MLTKRIIPCLDVKNNMVVKGKKFKNIKILADPVELAKKYRDSGADELVFYDISATHEGRDIFLDTVRNIAKNIDIPFTVGGGIRTINDFTNALFAGADKISVNSAAVNNPELINEASNKFGNQCVVLSLDVKTVGNQWKIYVNGGRKNTGLDAIQWAIEGVQRGAGELVINAIDEDGVQSGYAIDLMKAIAGVVSVPIIASGGAGKLEHFKDILTGDYVDGALAASVFHYNMIEIPKLKAYLAQNNINIRRV
ncbi:MAG: imidazole glycerol phosphate synthase subunit HisF [Alkaliphilus sp.]|nr:imidazole glycerol phosphate synthase subunit HisF [bacterium AH-315-L21]MBN4069272.1 imidazole glycerol phosphate synthase subunit HisF [bacterium AH-315-G05]PHS34859.1 MAG: imidazole glycerol phosphate synthase subunit HisF [Alkaliphilus sp.]